MDLATAHAGRAQGEHPECGVVHEPVERAVAALSGRELRDEVTAREVTDAVGSVVLRMEEKKTAVEHPEALKEGDRLENL